jgi:signal transduction histidine kinase/ligand-binding sensor domain-containing protein
MKEIWHDTHRFYPSLFFILCLSPYLFSQPAQFDQLIVNNVPQNENVLMIRQDSKGYIWIGTEDGLRKFDGTRYILYRHSKIDTSSISDDYITSFAEDCNGRLWIGTPRLLNRFDPLTETFKKYSVGSTTRISRTGNNVIALPCDKNGALWLLSHGQVFIYNSRIDQFVPLELSADSNGNPLKNITAVYEDIDGKRWIGTSHGLYIYDQTLKLIQVQHFLFKGNDSEFINTIKCDSEYNIWIGTFNGLIRYDRGKNEFTTFLNDPGNPNSLSNNQISTLMPDNDSTLWICSNMGLNHCYRDKKSLEYNFRHFTHVEGDNKSIPSNSITSAIFDNEGRLWITSRFGGVTILDMNSKLFAHFKQNLTDPASLSYNNVSSFTEDKEGYIWIATDEGGLNRMDPKTNKFSHFLNKPGDPNSIGSNKALAVHADSRNIIWIGYWGAGLDAFDPVTSKIIHYRYSANNDNTISSDYIFNLFEDSHNNIWICHWGAGVTLYERKSGNFIRMPRQQDSENILRESAVNVAYEDSKGTIWIGTENNGLFAYDYALDSFKQYVHTDEDGSLSHNTIGSLCEDRNGRLWIGTIGGGLNYYVPSTDRFNSLTTFDGLPSNSICGIEEDNNGLLWLSTRNGISRLKIIRQDTVDSVICKNYDEYDGLQGMRFNLWAYFKSSNGTIYFGGANGFNRFEPDKIKTRNIRPIVRITEIYLSNKKLTVNTPGIDLKTPVDELKELTIGYSQSMISIEFSIINSIDPSHNRYRYMLEGFDKTWNITGNYNKAVYTNLNPHEYTFRVQAMDNNGEWDESSANLKLIVTPPFWQTLWFKLLGAAILIFAGYSIYRIRFNSLKRELEKQREQEKTLNYAVQKAEESDKLKSTILNNISHEIRTPLNSILGFSELMARPNIKEEKRNKYIRIVKSSCSDLINSIDSLLSISILLTGGTKIEEGSMLLQDILDETIMKGVRKIEYEDKNLTIEVEESAKSSKTIISADIQKLRTILWHILDNAIKFSNEGIIRIHYEMTENLIKFSVTDPGIGIPDEIREKIFEQFKRFDEGLTRKFRGIGLGLALCKGFLNLLGGEIWFESEELKGTTFYFTYPYKSLHSAKER